MDAPAGATGAGPTAGSERIGFLDALRGLALFGIFLANIEWFTRPWQEFGNGVAQDLAGLDYAAAWFVHVFVSGKFWILFSLLFGIGFAVMMERAQAAARPARLYLRRLAALFVIGMAHALLVWVGDILHSYAIAGLLLLAMREVRPRVQLAVGLALYLGLCALSLLAGLAMVALPAGEMEAMTAHAVAESVRAGDAAAAVYAGGGFAEVTAQRLRDFSTMAWNNVGVVPMALGIFLLGSWLFRSGCLTDVAANRVFFVRMAAWCLPAGLALTLGAAWMSTGHPHGTADGWHVLAASLHGLAALPLTLGAVGVLALAWQSGTGARVLGMLAPTGRLALTNYLLQSMVASLVFYGYGLAMWGRIGYAGLVLLVLGVFALQVLASRWWLARFRFGPLEWAWRWFTYGVRPTMRKTPSDA